tara:strand:- start:1217 stop:2065 length:849 start_codon:yes stop_codon:yes gene_type:complete
MAKKNEKKVEVQEPQVEETVVMEKPKVETTKVKKEVKPEPKKDKWEIKDRLYVLKGNQTPLSRMISTKNMRWFDKEKGYEREVMPTLNQSTCFVDEMKGKIMPIKIVFRYGSLFVPRNKVMLQKFLSIYCPLLNNVYTEVNEEKAADNELEWLEYELEALNAAKNMDVDMAEAIMRVENGSKVASMSSRELKRDLLVFAKKDPALFLDLAKDENVQLRNIGLKAMEQNIINMSPDKRYFEWKNTGRKLMTVPFDENPYSALAQWFKTDEGVDVLSSIEKQLK